jgi:hypothetical protein
MKGKTISKIATIDAGAKAFQNEQEKECGVRDGLSFKIDTATLKAIANLISIAMDTEISVTEDGIKIAAFSTDQIGGVAIKVKKEFLKEQHGEGNFGIDTKKFKSIANMIEGEEVELWLENLSRLYFIEGNQKFFLDLINYECPEELRKVRTRGIILQDSSAFEIDYSEMAKALKNATQFDVRHAKIEFDLTEKKMKISIKKNVAGMEKTIPIKGEGTGKGGSQYVIDSIFETTKGASGTMLVEIKDQAPVKFKFTVANAEVEGLIAPRIEGD